MSHPVKCALITAFVSKTKDRFHEYNRELALDERLELVATMRRNERGRGDLSLRDQGRRRS